jgi:hypothetical protein
MNEMTYYARLFQESNEEKEIQKLLDEERASYENTEAYKEHIEKVTDLFERLKIAGQKRREEAKKYKPKRRPTMKRMTEKEKSDFREQTRKEKEARIDSYPEPLRNVIRTYEALDDQAKKVFKKETWAYESDYDDYKDPVTTEKDLSELLDVLVQTIIDFINERNLTDIDSIGFGADGLQESADAGEWIAYTDANIYATGLGTVKGKDGHEYTVAQKIGSYM